MIRTKFMTLAILAVMTVAQAGAQSLPCPTCGRVSQAVTVKRVRSLEASAVDSSSISRAFMLANTKRATAGLGPLGYDPEMTRGAQIKADRAAALGIRGHQGGSMYGGNKEGVGWSSGPETPSACYLMTAPAGTPSGFAMAQGRRGWHSVLLINHGGRLPSGASGGGPMRRLFGGRIFSGRFLERFRR